MSGEIQNPTASPPCLSSSFSSRPTIGLLVSIAHRHQPLWVGAVDAARARNVNLVCFIGGEVVTPDRLHIQHSFLHELPAAFFYDLADVERLDGVITWAGSGVGLGMHLDDNEMERFVAPYRARPIVNYEGIMEGIPSVITDTHQGMCALLAHVIETHGCRRIALMRGPKGHMESEERYRAYLDTLTHYGLPINPDLICPPTGWGPPFGHQMINLLLDERNLKPGHDLDAIACTEIDYAIGSIEALKARGVSVPDQVAVVGFNDRVGAQTCSPPITTMQKPFYEAGFKALETVLDLIEGKPVPDRISIPARLVIRRSCGCWALRTNESNLQAPCTGDTSLARQPPPNLDAYQERTKAELACQLSNLVPPEQAENWATLLLNALVDVLTTATPDETASKQVYFWTTLEKALHETRSEEKRAQWHAAISALFHHPVPGLAESATGDRFWQQVRIVIEQEIQRSELALWTGVAEHSRILLEIGQEMMSASTIPQLTDVLVRRLPELGIFECYLGLYENPRPRNTSRSAPEWAKLILAFQEGQRLHLEPKRQRFLTRHLVPDGLLPRDRAHVLVATPLHFGRRQFGFALFQAGPQNGPVFQSLAQEISSALQSVLLLRDYQQTERALRESEASMRTLIEHIPVELWAKDVSGKYIMQNPINRQSMGDNVGLTLEELPIKDLLRAEWKTQDARVLDGETLQSEHVFHFEDQERIYRQIVTPVRVDDKIQAILGIMIDVTEQKQMEASLRQAKEAAEAANQAKSRFLANISHELRTPLNAILGFAELMTHDQALTGRQRENLEIIDRSGKHLLALINDVLDLSKIETGKVEMQPVAFNLHEMLLGLGEMFSLRAQQKGLTVVFDLAPDVPQYVRADAGKLRQVLINLLGNAAKFTTTGSVILNVTARTPHANAQLDLGFEIQDTGVGIAANELDRVFDAFVQTESGRQSGQGTGLGLTISREYVRLMGGELTVHSQVGVGSTFCFDLPVQVIATPQAVQTLPTQRIVGVAPGQQAPEGGPYRLLIADDDQANRQLLAQLLQPLGFALREARDGQEAVSIWQEWRPHLIWMDANMPVMDGLSATQQMKSGQGEDKPIVVLVTASAFEEDRQRILKLGGDDFIRKPFHKTQIFDALTRHLGIRFLYEADRVQDTAEPISPHLLRGASTEWRVAMRQALVIGDTAQMNALIDQLPGPQVLLDELRKRVRQFDHESIFRWIEAAQQE